jgi:hypothetical protein
MSASVISKSRARIEFLASGFESFMRASERGGERCGERGKERGKGHWHAFKAIPAEAQGAVPRHHRIGELSAAMASHAITR